jgi:hypothetical protein
MKVVWMLFTVVRSRLIDGVGLAFAVLLMGWLRLICRVVLSNLCFLTLIRRILQLL